MSRSVEVATVIGGAALAGVGIVPFLHRTEAADVWFHLQWPRDVDEDDVRALLRHLASSRRPQLVTFEIRASGGHLRHLVGVVKADTERLRHLFTSYLPDVLVNEVEREPLALARAIELRLGTRERGLRTDAASEVAKSVAGAMAGTTGTTILQWQIGGRLAPSHVPKDSVGLPTTGRALSQAVRYGLAPIEARARSELQAKIGDHGFRATLRIASTISESRVAQGVLRAVVGGLRVAEAPGVLFKVRRTDAGAVAHATPPRRLAMALNVMEITGLLGWPLGDGDYPGVTRIKSRRLPVPSAVPATGRVIGEGNHPSSQRPVTQRASDALMHTHVLGPTGVGKSTLLANLALQDIAAGRGVVVIEPKGDLVSDILARIPKEREGDVIVLDPSDVAAPVGLNPLASGSPELVADQLLATFRGLYGDYLGPRTTDVLHAALLTLARSEHATLVGLPLLLTDDGVRRELTAPVRGDLALGPFWAWYDGLSEPERQQVIAPVMNKVRPFLLRERVRHVLGQARPRFDITQVFTERKILLVPLGKGALGSESASLIGSLVVARLWQAAQARSRVAAERRHFVSVVIDEFQDFLHLPTDLADVLTQARGLGMGLTLAHQHLAQLSPAIRAAVLANARSRICFRLSAEDAAVVVRTTERLDARDFQSLGRYEIYASLVANSETQLFCSASTKPLPDASGDARRVRRLSRERYGVKREAIESELHRLWNRADAVEKTALGSRRRRPLDGETDGGPQ